MEQEDAFRLSFLLQQYRKINAYCRETYWLSKNAAFPPRAGTASKTRSLFLKAAPQNVPPVNQAFAQKRSDQPVFRRLESSQESNLHRCGSLPHIRPFEAVEKLTPVPHGSKENSLVSLASSQATDSIFEDFLFDMEEIELESLPSVSQLSQTSDNYTAYEKYAYQSARSYLSQLTGLESTRTSGVCANEGAEYRCAAANSTSSWIDENLEPSTVHAKQCEQEITDKLEAIRRVDPYFLRKKTRQANIAVPNLPRPELGSEDLRSFVSLDVSLADSANEWTVYKSTIVQNELGFDGSQQPIAQNRSMNDVIRRFREENAAWPEEGGEEQYFCIEEEA